MKMLNFIKYEWLRRWKFFLAGILVFVLADLDLFSRIISQESPNYISVILIALVFTLSAALVVDHLGRLYRTLFSDEGFTELTLPLSGYQLLGAKLLAIFLECVAVMTIVGIVAYFDAIYVDMIALNWQLPSLTWEIGLEVLKGLGFILGGYIILVLMVYLSLALAKSIFATFKHGILIAFGCFIVLAKVVDYLGDILSVSARYYLHGSVAFMTTTDWLIIIVLIGLLFISTGFLLNRKMNL